MPPTPAADPDRNAFLVERYLPAAAANGLAASVARVALLCTDPEDAGLGVQYLHSAYLPSEDTCFCLFRAASADAVRRVNGEGDFAFDRITDAVVLLTGVDTYDATQHPARSAQPTEETR
jgi:Protein of unknown function (DUF4242)